MMTSLGQSVRMTDDPTPDDGPVYAFAHETLLAAAEEQFALSRQGFQRIVDTWAEDLRAQGWARPVPQTCGRHIYVARPRCREIRLLRSLGPRVLESATCVWIPRGWAQPSRLTASTRQPTRSSRPSGSLPFRGWTRSRGHCGEAGLRCDGARAVGNAASGTAPPRGRSRVAAPRRPDRGSDAPAVDTHAQWRPWLESGPRHDIRLQGKVRAVAFGYVGSRVVLAVAVDKEIVIRDVQRGGAAAWTIPNDGLRVTTVALGTLDGRDVVLAVADTTRPPRCATCERRGCSDR